MPIVLQSIIVDNQKYERSVWICDKCSEEIVDKTKCISVTIHDFGKHKESIKYYHKECAIGISIDMRI
jgi:hypothetical protein